MKFRLAILFWLFAAAAFAQTTSENAVRFAAVDIYCDSGATALAAYQLEFRATNGNAKIVGVEGGEHAAFKEAPYYDPKAMQQERVILAAFSTGRDLPSGRTRVATIHLQITGSQDPGYSLKLEVMADSEGRKLSGTATFEERKAP